MKANGDGNFLQRLATAFFSERAATISPIPTGDDARSGKPLLHDKLDFLSSFGTERARDGNVVPTNKSNLDNCCDQPTEYNIGPKISIIQARQESVSVSSSSIRSDRELGQAMRVMRWGAQPRCLGEQYTDSRQVILLDLLLNPTYTDSALSFCRTAGTVDDLRRLPRPHTGTPRHRGTVLVARPVQVLLTKHWTRFHRALERRCATHPD